MLNNAFLFETVQGFTVIQPRPHKSLLLLSSSSSSVRQYQNPLPGVRTTTSSFQPSQRRRQRQSVMSSSQLVLLLFAKRGFGDQPEKKTKSTGQVKREQERSKYDEIAATGGQEYNIFVRQFGSDDKSWLPCGAVAVPRSAQVADAIYANVESLKGSIVRTYPRLAGFEEEFEFGFNLKIYPDDPIEVVTRRTTPRDTGLSVGNWLTTLFSPIDASKVPPPPMKE